MNSLADLMGGFQQLLTPYYFLMCVAGVVLGQMVGALPGIGPSTAIALLLPLTFGADPTASLIMFAGIYAGSQYGGTLTAVLVNVPGESSSVMTALDGYQLALQGRAGSTLAIAAISSFVAGTLGTVGLMFLAPPLAKVALVFGPAEYFALVLLGLTSLAAAGGSVIRGLVMGIAGLLLATVGIDGQSGNPRFTFGQLWLLDGVEFLIVAIAMFGLGEVLVQASDTGRPSVIRVDKVMPTREDLRRSRAPMLRGTAIGFVIGVLPAAGATIASFIAYTVEKKVSKTPERFGKGTIEAVAGPEAANNSAVSGNMVPMFSLGIPGSGATALMLGAMIMYGLRPGPNMFAQNGDLVWGVIASLYIGNLILLVFNLPLAGLFARLLAVPYSWLYPPIVALCILGTYSEANSLQDCWLLVGFGIAGWLFKRYSWPIAPLVLGLVLGPILENSLRQAMAISRGDPSIFVMRPIAATLIAITVLLVLSPILVGLANRFRSRHRTA